MNRKFLLVGALLSAGVLACGDSTSNSNDATKAQTDSEQETPGDPTCALNASACPDGCDEVRGSSYDAEKNCVSQTDVVYGCWNSALPANADDVCFKRSADGLVIRAIGSNRFDAGVWERCDASLSENVTTAAKCTSQDPTERSADCPASATECPNGCLPVEAQRFDPAGQCFGSKEVVSCWPTNLPMNADAPCVERVVDGVAFLAPSGSPFLDVSVWTPCSLSPTDCASPK